MTLDDRSLQGAFHHSGLSLEDFWLRYFSLGGMANEAGLRSYLDGRVVPSDAEYDYIAHAFNERFLEIQEPGLVPYADDPRRHDTWWTP